MADEMEDSDDKTEEATPERREDFRDRGNVAISKDITAVAVLAGVIALLSTYLVEIFYILKKLIKINFETASFFRVNRDNIVSLMTTTWLDLLYLIAPIFLVVTFCSIASTFLQTGFNFSWKKIEPDFTRLNPLSGLVQMVNVQAWINLGKSIIKMIFIGLISYWVLQEEVRGLTGLMNFPVEKAWSYCANITKILFWNVIGFTLAIAIFDFGYNYFVLEKKMKMTKQDVKEDYKKREVDPQVKAKIRRMARDLSMGKMIESTKDATVLLMNPTHFAVALKYDLGMKAPIVVAKAQDYNALRLKEIALENSVTVVENPPLARLLFRTVDIGKEVPDDLYKSVSEVIRYVFKLKGRNLSRRSN